jgi:hypothetical protein
MFKKKFDLNILEKLNTLNLHNDIKLSDAINSLTKNNIDINNVSIGFLSMITYSEYLSYYNIDDIFFYIIIFLNILIFVSSNNFFMLKVSKKNRIIILKIYRYSNITLAIVLILYSIYMIKMLSINKQYLLSNRFNRIYINIFTAINILISSFNLQNYIK